tara:strand:- start:6516 stop:7331 length:816 start_codon:yes stop_codon:yes gene_type:complete
MSRELKYIDEDKEVTGDAYSSEPQEDKGNPQEMSETAETPESNEQKTTNGDTEVSNDGSIKVGAKEFSSVEDLKQSYENLEKVLGRQSGELGELRKSVEQINTNMNKVEEPVKEAPVFDPYDSTTHEPYLNYLADKKLDEKMRQLKVEQSQKNAENAQRQMIEDFRKKNPDLSQNQLMQIAEFADKRGISIIDDAYQIFSNQQNQEKTKKQAVQEHQEKLKKAADTPKTLSSVSGSNIDTSQDFDRMSDREWSKLSQDQRRKALMDAPQGY